MPVKEAVAAFREERAALLHGQAVPRSDGALGGGGFCATYAGLVDRFVAGLLPEGSGLALVAVGGYGRSELCPGSDVDLVLLHRRRDRREVPAVADGIWYPLWDTGLKVGHAVRTVKDAVALAASDLDTATALLDARLVAGDADLGEELARRALEQWRSHATRWLRTLAESVERRHAKAGEVAFLLEPDLKDGRGGLRDVHALRWAETARRLLVEGDARALGEAYDVLLAARVELQRQTGKSSDVLLLQEQDGVASALGDSDADALMGRIAAAARTVAWTSDETWDRIRSSLRGPTGRLAGGDRQLGPGLVLREGLVELDASAYPAGDATLVLRAAAAAAQAGTRLGRTSLDRLASEAVVPPGPWPAEAREALVDLLGSGRAAIPVLEALDQKGILVRLLPEWAPVRSRPQRNAYHRFTVDRHLCEAAAEAAALTGRVRRADLLLTGTWLHDIGKGRQRPGDHSSVGAQVMAEVAARLGFDPDDVDVLVTLVQHHLLLAETATRRDIDDPETVRSVAQKVGDVDTLELLAALTEADGIATGASAWNAWRAGLVRDLVVRARALLAGDEPPAAPFPSPDDFVLTERVRATGAPAAHGSGRAFTVAVPDRPGVFSRVAGTLSLHNLDVLAARAWSSPDGVAVETFVVEPLLGGEPPWDQVADDVARALDGGLPLDDRLAGRARAHAGRSPAKAATPARTKVAVDNAASRTATVIEVRAPDAVGTLYCITRALAGLQLDIRHAKVATLGHEVVDVFYVVAPTGGKVTDPASIEAVEAAIRSQLAAW